MTSSLSNRLLANVLRKAASEKEEALQAEWASQQAALNAEEEASRRKVAELAKKRKDLDDRAKIEREEMDTLRSSLAEAEVLAGEEQRTDKLGARIAEFRGSDRESLRTRLLSEGFPEAMTQEMLRLRTLDQELENRFGMPAAFIPGQSQQDPRSTPLGPWQERGGDDRPYMRQEEVGSVYRSHNPEAEMVADQRAANAGGNPLYAPGGFAADSNERKNSDARDSALDAVRKGLGLSVEDQSSVYKRA